MADQTPEQVAAAAAADARIQELVSGAVKSSLDALVKEGAETQRQRAATQAEETASAAAAEEARKRGQDPFSTVLQPHLEPALKAARDAEARANLAADSVAFYTDPANTDAMKYRAKIEDVVQAQLKRGNQITRSDAWNWLRGGELYKPLQEEYVTAHQAKLDEARKATAAAGSSPATIQFKRPIHEMDTAELGEAIKNVSF